MRLFVATEGVGLLSGVAPFDVCGRPSDDRTAVEPWERNADGGLAMQATTTDDSKTRDP